VSRGQLRWCPTGNPLTGRKLGEPWTPGHQVRAFRTRPRTGRRTSPLRFWAGPARAAAAAPA
jgi:hypothetical protein